MLDVCEFVIGMEVNWNTINFLRFNEDVITDYVDHIQIKRKEDTDKFPTFIFRDNQWIYVGLCYKDKTFFQRKFTNAK